MDILLTTLVFVLVFATTAAVLSARREAILGAQSRASRLQVRVGETVEPTVMRRRALIASAPDWLASIRPLRKISESLAEAGLETTLSQFMIISVIVFAAGLGVGTLVWRDHLYALATAAGAGAIPYAYVRFRRQRRLDAFMNQLPNALEVIKSSLEAGHSLHRALQVLVGEFGEPLGPEFRSAIEQTQIGLSLPRALEEMLRRVPVDDLRLMVVAVKVQSQVGSSLAPIIGKLAELVRSRQRLKLQVQALTAQLRFSGVVVALLPAVVLAVSSFVQPHYVHMLFHDPQGFALFKAAVVMDIAAYLIIRRMMRLEY